MPPRRTGVWEFFHETTFHPSAGTFGKPKLPAISDPQDKQRTYCIQCYNQDFNFEYAKDVELKRGGRIQEVRTEDQIRLHLYAIQEKANWTAARVDTMRNHLKGCIYQPPEAMVRIEELIQEFEREKAFRTATKHGRSFTQPPSERLGQNSSVAGSFHEPMETDIPSNQSQAPFPQLPPSSSAPPSLAPSGVVTPSSGSLGPYDSISHGNTPIETSSTVSNKRLRTNSHAYLPVRPVDSESQEFFEKNLIRVVASADLSFNLMENPEVVNFFRVFMPGYTLPSRRQLSGRILTKTLDEIREQICASPKKELVTLQCDGWMGRNQQHLVAFMMTTASGKVKYFYTAQSATEN